MDLTIKLQDTTLNIRVAVIMETNNGFIFEKSKNGYYFTIGGRVKLGETSLETAKREIKEETGLDINNFKLISVLENFYGDNENKVQEICFVYTTDKIDKIDLEYNLSELSKDDIENLEIKPEIIKNLILENKLDAVSHFIIKD